MGPASWHHGRYVRRITNLLSAFLDAHDLGNVLVGEVGVYVGRGPDTVRAPDVLFISNDRLARVQSESYLDVAPDLVVEMVSPGTVSLNAVWEELREKTAEYLAGGVERAWIVEPARRTALSTPSRTRRSRCGRGTPSAGRARSKGSRSTWRRCSRTDDPAAAAHVLPFGRFSSSGRVSA